MRAERVAGVARGVPACRSLSLQLCSSASSGHSLLGAEAPHTLRDLGLRALWGSLGDKYKAPQVPPVRGGLGAGEAKFPTWSASQRSFGGAKARPTLPPCGRGAALQPAGARTRETEARVGPPAPGPGSWCGTIRLPRGRPRKALQEIAWTGGRQGERVRRRRWGMPGWGTESRPAPMRTWGAAAALAQPSPS